ncbi:unnamed protein product [marine sediment metagenome]|uniref:Uncharacterized protein n=1 Tax=marine sediment metagenome TaxID=412755 RepID=X0TPS0_9ZZZZ
MEIAKLTAIVNILEKYQGDMSYWFIEEKAETNSRYLWNVAKDILKEIKND